MRRVTLVLALLLGLSAPVRAALTEADLAAVEIAPPPGARLPPDLPLVDDGGRAVTPAGLRTGRPAVLVLADFTCTTLCGTALAMAAASLEAARLVPGTDYDLLVLGLDPRDGPAEAAALKAARLGRTPLAAGARFLTGDAATLAAAQAALGYRARYDAENDVYAHPLGALVLAGDGRVSGVLGGLRLEPEALRLALAEAGRPAGRDERPAGRDERPAGQDKGPAGLVERLRLLCYGFDPLHGAYNALVKRALTWGTLATMAGLGLFILLLVRRGRRA